jgi:catechol 2,3-dioxygenase
MDIESLGHVVIRVRQLQRAEDFYNGLLGIPISARAESWAMTFFTLGSHHDFAIAAVGENGKSPTEKDVGLDHVAFRLGGGIESLRQAKSEIEAAGIPVAAMDHVVTQSIYFHDPDGNTVELYVDAPCDWKSDPSLLRSEGRPLSL